APPGLDRRIRRPGQRPPAGGGLLRGRELAGDALALWPGRRRRASGLLLRLLVVGRRAFLVAALLRARGRHRPAAALLAGGGDGLAAGGGRLAGLAEGDGPVGVDDLGVLRGSVVSVVSHAHWRTHGPRPSNSPTASRPIKNRANHSSRHLRRSVRALGGVTHRQRAPHPPKAVRAQRRRLPGPGGRGEARVPPRTRASRFGKTRPPQRNSAAPGAPLDEDSIVDQEAADDVPVDDGVAAGEAGFLHELVDGGVHGRPPLAGDGGLALLGRAHEARDDLVGRLADVLAEVAQQPVAQLLLLVAVAVQPGAVEPAHDRRRRLDLFRRKDRLLGAHSGRPNRRASCRTSAARFSTSTGSWMSPESLSFSVTAASSSNGVSRLLRKAMVEIDRRGRCPPVRGSSAGYPTSSVQHGSQWSGY